MALGKIALAAAAAVAVSPLVVLARVAILPPGPLEVLSTEVSTYGLGEVFKLGMAQALASSLAVTALTVAIALALSLPTAYAVTRLGIGFAALFATALAVTFVRTIPPSSYLVSAYVSLYDLGLLDTHIGLALAYQIYAFPLAMWLLLSFAADLDPDVDSAARIDGASPTKRFFHIFLPAVSPGVAAAAVLTALAAWGEYLYASVLMSSKNQTAAMLLGSLLASEFRSEWSVIASAALLTALPPLLFVTVAVKNMQKLSFGTAGGLWKK
ncbi:MAG: ABC transporter permease subunit [Pyrobaculum sp.]